jgi:hypothetical protein
MIQLISKPIEDKILFSQKLLREVTETFKGKQVIVTIEEFNPKKSDQKRKQYFAGIVAPLKNFLGYESKDELHEDLKLTCNPVERKSLHTGEILIVGGSTKRFTLDQWDEYKERCRKLAKRLGYKLMTESEYYDSITNSEDNQEAIGEQ